MSFSGKTSPISFSIKQTISLFSGEKLYLDFELILHASNENYFKSVTHSGSIFTSRVERHGLLEGGMVGVLGTFRVSSLLGLESHGLEAFSDISKFKFFSEFSKYLEIQRLR